MTSESTKNKLISAFYSLAKDKDLKKITISELTKTAGVHRSTFYEYFIDIIDLIGQEENEILELQKELIINPLEQNMIDPFNKNSAIPLLIKLYELKGMQIATLLGPHGDLQFKDALMKNMRPQFEQFLSSNSNTYNDYLIEFISIGLMAVINKVYAEKEIPLNDIVPFLYSTIVSIIVNKQEL